MTDACQSCNGPLQEFLDLGFHPPTSVFTHSRSSGPKTLYPLGIFRCDSCGLIQSGYVTDPNVLFGGEYFYNSGATASFKKHLEDLAERLMKELNPKFVVDIGSNDGTALMPYHKAGIKVLGIEPSAVGYRAEVTTIHDFANEKTAKIAKTLNGQADLITAYNVFAHTPLEETMKSIDALLKPAGVFVNESQYLAGIVSETAYDTFYLEHLRTYSLHTMISLLARWGFEVFRAERTVGIGDSILVFACRSKRIVESQRYGFTPPMNMTFDDLLKLEDDLCLQNPQTYTDFATRVKQSKVDLNLLLWRLKKEGKRIVGIGAPGRSTTIINYCGLGPDLIDYLVETNPLKVGCFSPGTEIPVVSEERLMEDQPEYAILFVWHLPQIADKLRAKGFKGRFIIPLPKVEIVYGGGILTNRLREVVE